MLARTFHAVCRAPLVYHAICVAQRRSIHWPAFRASVLREQPACEATGITEQLEVHHIEPFHERPDLELVRSNVIVLTAKPISIHQLLGHLRSWRSKNPGVRADAFAMLDKIRNRA